MSNSHFSRLGLCLLALVCASAAPRAQAQKLDENGQPIVKTTTPPAWLELSPPPEQTVDGVRVRLRAICWCRVEQLDLPEDQYVEGDGALSLAIRYEVVGDAATEGKRGTLTQAKIYGASGAPNSALSPQSISRPGQRRRDVLGGRQSALENRSTRFGMARRRSKRKCAGQIQRARRI